MQFIVLWYIIIWIRSCLLSLLFLLHIILGIRFFQWPGHASCIIHNCRYIYNIYICILFIYKNLIPNKLIHWAENIKSLPRFCPRVLLVVVIVVVFLLTLLLLVVLVPLLFYSSLLSLLLSYSSSLLLKLSSSSSSLLLLSSSSSWSSLSLLSTNTLSECYHPIQLLDSVLAVG